MRRYNSLIRSTVLFAVLSLTGTSDVMSQLIAHFPMELKDGKIIEQQSGKSFIVNGCFPPENTLGAEGYALRLDGYSTYVTSTINTDRLSSEALTFSLWCAVETYPMMNNDGAVNTSTFIAGNMNEEKKSGFAFLLSSQGDYSFECYVGGWKVSCKANEKFEKYFWNHLVAVVDMETKEVRIYRNSELLGNTKIRIDAPISVGEEVFLIGKSFGDVTTGTFLLNTINGLIDDIRVYNTVLSADEAGYKTPEHTVDLSIPVERFENDILRPIFHGMPAANWTNEPHGLTYYNGRYHLFFQKNANGPYWGRLHWGHITSENLYDWKEEKIALSPSIDYDWKGCWSGCVFTDAILTGGKPHLFYTAVDNVKATIAEAIPSDEHLIGWIKDSRNPIISSRPTGLSDDFRDPYVFTSNGEYYMIVGTSKDGIGAATLHCYDKVSKTWSNDGSIFFKGRNASIAGTFWEMPVIVPMSDDRWLFIATPLGGRQGVKVLYWVGTIADNGTFNPLPAYQNEPEEMELSGMSKDGYGLLSPSLFQIESGKHIAIGIVPDKLNSRDNYALGWAHTFSLPRELTLDENNQLVQKPYSNLSALRTETHYSAVGLSLDGIQELTPVSGRCLEVRADFTIGTADKIGLRLFKNGNQSVEVYYEPKSNKIVVDARSIERLKNDEGSFNGFYESTLPVKAGSSFDLHVYVDHSIMDIFVNEKWAFSVRLFPTDGSATGVELFSDGGETNFGKLDAWILDPKSGGSGTRLIEKKKDSIRLISISGFLKYENLPKNAMLLFSDFSGKLLAQTPMSDSFGMIRPPVLGSCIVSVIAPGVRYSEKMVFYQ